MDWFWTVLLALGVLAILTFLQGQESSLYTVYPEDVAKEEETKGRSHRTNTLKRLLKRRMTLINFILLLIFLLLIFTDTFIEWISGGVHWTSQDTFLFVFAIILFFVGEIVPKNIGYRYALKHTLSTALFWDAVLRMFSPITWVLQKFDRLSGGEERLLVGDEDIIAAVKIAHEQGSLHKGEADFLTNAIHVGNRRLGEVCIPLEKYNRLALKPTLGELRAALMRPQDSVIVIHHTLKEATVTGVVLVSEAVALALSKEGGDSAQQVDLSPLVKGCVDLEPHMTVSQVLGLLTQNRYGVVVSRGKVAGLITMSYLSEQIFRSAGAK